MSRGRSIGLCATLLALLVTGCVAAAGRARLARVADGPPVGNVILARGDRVALASRQALLAHAARHATQYAWCGGLAMVPLYFLAAGVSWGLTGDFGVRNVFERQAGLADGGYTDKPLRPVLARFARSGGPSGGTRGIIGLPRGPRRRVRAGGEPLC